jgi:hypothetical protein
VFVVTGLALATAGAWASGSENISKLPNFAAAPAERGWPLRVMSTNGRWVRRTSA